MAADVIESCDAAIVAKDLRGVIQLWSRGAERLFGYTAAEVVGRSITLLIPPDRAREEEDILARIQRGERVERFETVRLAKDGRRIDVSVTISPVRDASGKVIGASKIAEDVMERRRLEEARSRLAAIVDSSDDAIVSKDLRGIIQSWNVGAERIFGYTAEEAVGRSITMVIPPDRRREEEEILAKLAAGERIEHYETVRVTKLGRAIDLSLTISPIRNAAGQIVGASKIARDITDRKRIERDLAAQREWFRVTLSSVGDAVVASDIEGKVTFLNAEAEKLTGWLSQEAEGQPVDAVFRIVDEESHESIEDPAGAVLRLGRSIRLSSTSMLVSRDGTERPIADSAAPIFDDARRIIGVVVVFRDVTSERRAERIVEERRQWQERLLESERAARGEAERANRVKDDFVATLSHELRTPLNAILGWTQILQRSTPAPELVQRGVEVIERNTRLQSQLVADLLDISRIISGKLSLDLHHLDLASVVESAVDTLKVAAEAKQIEIALEVAEPIQPMAADPARLQQVIWNLMSNAVKFTPAGGRIEVHVAQAAEEACITVRDTGIGIRPEYLPALFDRFSQGDSSVTRRFGGLGLGLAIVKQLVEMHGGTVEAVSEGEGHGATFTVRLPVRELRLRSDPQPSGRAMQSRRAASSADTDLSGLRILVVEDEADTADLLERFLVSAGANVTVVRSAPAALEILEEVSPHLLVSDIGMPEVDGIELIRRVRSMGAERGGVIPAVAVTALARPEDRTRALLAGFQAHLAKPIEAVELVATVRAVAGLSLWAPTT